MKIFSRIATAITVALVSLFVAAPAFAAGGHGDERFDGTEPFSTAGQPVDVVATLITGAVLLVVVLLLATWLSGLFRPAAESQTGE